MIDSLGPTIAASPQPDPAPNNWLFESSPDCVKVIDLDGCMLAMNRNGLQLMEIDDFDTRRGSPWASLWAADVAPTITHALDQARAGGTGRFTSFGATAKGTPRWWDVIVTPVRDRDGNIDKLLSVSRDVTEVHNAKHAAEASEARFRSVLRAVSAIVWVTPPSGAFETEQAEWAAFTGQSFDEIKGSGWLDAVHPEDRARTIGAARTARHDCAPFQLQQRLRRADGQYRHMSVQVVPVMNADGTLREWVGAHSDVTDQKNAEELLRQSAKNLAEADRRKSEFISTLAHELRNPLAPIRSGLQVMQMAADKPETVARVRAVMERQVAHMVHLIDDLLDIGRISHGQIELRRKAVDLRDIVASAVETSMPLIDASRHALTLALDDEPFSLFADPVRIAQVLSNLLNNAAKYTPAGGLIRLSAQRQEREVVITVTDSGIGIPQESLALVFDMFTQLGQRHERAQGGLGIGLSLVRTLVEMHDGVVSATSEGGGRGASFSVRLPLAEA